MPLYVHPIHLFIEKSAVIKRIDGGVPKLLDLLGFTDYPHLVEEDDHLIGIKTMDAGDFDLSIFQDADFPMNTVDSQVHSASNFVILYRHYGEFSWPCENWIKHNLIFAWHTDASDYELAEVKKRSNCTWNEVDNWKGGRENYFKPITKSGQVTPGDL